MAELLKEDENIMCENELTQAQIDFLQSCMEQNLEHARHVENERLTFNSIYMAMVGCTLAFVFSLDNLFFAAGISLILIIIGFIAMLLTKRWDNTFDRHIEFAKRDYKAIHKCLFPEIYDEDEIPENEGIEGINSLPAYCFRPKNPEPKTSFGRVFMKIRTRRLFAFFYWMIQIVLAVCFIYFIFKICGA